MNKKDHKSTTLLIALLLISVFGCDSPKVHYAKVTGKVTLDGKPLDCGSVKFIATDGNTPSGGGTILNDGSYMAQVPPGKKKVLVISYKETVSKVPMYQGVENSPMRKLRVLITPPIYKQLQRTPLEADIIDQEDNKLDFKLVSNPPT